MTIKYALVGMLMISLSSCVLESDEADSSVSTSYIRSGQFIVTSISSNSIRLQWSKAYIQYSGGIPSVNYSTLATTNTIQRSNSNGTFVALTTLPGDSLLYIDNTLDSTISYSYRIASKFPSDTTIYSNIVQIRFGATYLPLNTLPGSSFADFTPDGAQIVTLGSGGVIRFWDIKTCAFLRQLLSTPNFQSFSSSFAISPSGKYIAAIGDFYDSLSQSIRGEVNIIQLSNSAITLRYHGQIMTSCGTFGMTDEEFISGGFEPSLAFWKVANGLNTRQLNPDSIYILNLAIDRLHATLGTASSSNNIIRLINANTGEVVQNLSGHGTHTYVITYSKDGKYLATDAEDNKIAFWDVTAGTLLRTLGPSPSNLSSVCISPDDSLLIGGYGDGGVRVWNSFTGKTLTTLTQHTQPISRIVINPNARILLSCGSDKVVIWSMQNSSGGWYVAE